MKSFDFIVPYPDSYFLLLFLHLHRCWISTGSFRYALRFSFNLIMWLFFCFLFSFCALLQPISWIFVQVKCCFGFSALSLRRILEFRSLNFYLFQLTFLVDNRSFCRDSRSRLLKYTWKPFFLFFFCEEWSRGDCWICVQSVWPPFSGFLVHYALQ